MEESSNYLAIKKIRKSIANKKGVIEKLQVIDGLDQEHKESVLLVDDDKMNSLFYVKNLNGSSKVNKVKSIFCPVIALSYLEELDNEKKPFPTLILLDIEMPIINGTEFLKIFIEKFPRKKTKIILFSTHDKNYLEEEMKEESVIGYLSKPLDIKKFEKIINQ